MKILFLLYFFLHFPLFKSQTNYSQNPCLGLDPAKKTCLTCSYNYFPSIAFSSNISATRCSLRITNQSYIKTVYVSNQTVCNNSVCNGNITNPYISLFKAFEAEMTAANNYTYSELNFLIMNSTHFLIRNDLLPATGVSHRQFFRRINVKLYIGPFMCYDQMSNITYNRSDCFKINLDGSIGSKPTIYLKTAEFYIFVANQLVIENIIFDGRDMILHYLGGVSSTADYNKKQVICTESLMLDDSSNCLLFLIYFYRAGWDQRAWVYGFLNIEGFFDNFDMKKPLLILNNTVFLYILPLNDYTWISLIYVNDIPGDLILENCVFNRSEMAFGLIYHNLYRLDRFFKNFSELWNRSYSNPMGNNLIVRKTLVCEYNNYQIWDDTYYGDTNLETIFCLYNFGKLNPLNSFTMDQVTVKNISFSYGYQNSILNFKNSSNIIINNSLIYLMYSVNNFCFLNTANVTISNFQVNTFLYKYQSFFTLVNSSLSLSNIMFYYIDHYASSSLSYGMILLSSNSTLNITTANFTFLNYAPIVIQQSILLMQNVYFYNNTYYRPIFQLISGSLTLRSVVLNSFLAYSSTILAILETKLITGSFPNSIIVKDLSVINSTAKSAYFFSNKLLNSEDIFQFERLRFSGCRFVYYFFLQQINNLTIQYLQYSNYSTGQFIQVWTIFTTIQLSNILIKNCTFKTQFIWASSSKSGLIQLNNLTLYNSSFQYYQFIILDIPNLYLANWTLSNFSVSYPSSTEIDILKFTCDGIVVSNFQVIFTNVSFRSFLSLTNSQRFSMTNCSFSSDDGRAYLIVLYMKYIVETIIDNLSFNNIKCYQNSKRVGEENGILTALSSDDTLFKSQNNSLSFSNVILTNVTSCKSGCLGFINIHNMTISSVIISNTDVLFSGGGFSILCSSSVYFENISISNTSALQGEGGAFDLYQITSIFITNLSLSDCQASNAGGLVMENLGNFTIINSIFIRISAVNEAGVFYLISCMLTVKNSLFENCSAGSMGGVFDVYDGNLIIDNSYSLMASALNGGFMYLGIINNLLLSNSKIIKTKSESDGINIVISDCNHIHLENTSFTEASSSFGSGNIFLENQNENSHEFINVVFSGGDIAFGSCIYYNSNDALQIENLTAVENQGILFFMTTQSESKISMKNLDLRENNLQKTDTVANQVFYLKSLKVSLENIFLSQTLAEENVIELDTCELIMNNSRFYKIFDDTNFHKPVALTILYAYNSDLTLINNTFDNSHAKVSLIYLKCLGDNVHITNSKFLNGFDSDQAVLFIQKSEVELINSNISNNRGKTAGAIYFQYSFVNISNCIFINNSNIYFLQGLKKIGNPEEIVSDIYLNNFNADSEEIVYFFYLESSFFQITTGISIYSIYTTLITVKFCVFSIYDTKPILAQMLNLVETQYFLLNNSKFSNFTAVQGSCIFLSTVFVFIEKSLSILNNDFRFAKATLGGVFYINGDYNITLTNNNFFQNLAYVTTLQTGIAGVGYFFCFDCFFLKFYVFRNTFRNNYAESFAGTIFSFKKITPNINYFNNNSDFSKFTGRLASFPFKVYFFNYSLEGVPAESITKLLSTSRNYLQMNEFSLSLPYSSTLFLTLPQNSSLFIASGQTNNFTLILTESSGTVLSFENSAASKLGSSDKVLLEKATADAVAGFIKYLDTKINKEPGTEFNAAFETQIKFSTYFPLLTNFSQKNTLTINLAGFSRECVVGERYNPTDFSCTQCPYGQYSLDDPMLLYKTNKSLIKCNICPDYAVCWNGNQISPNPGYWRNSENSSLVLECIAKDACVGYLPIGESPVFSIQNKTLYISGSCLIHQGGNLCYICEKGYARFSSKRTCEYCKDNTLVYFKAVVALSTLLFYIYLQVKVTFKANNVNYMGILLKLLMNHLQQISMISLVQLGWTPNIKDYFNYQEYFSFISEEFISIDCFVQDFGFDIIAEKIIFSNILPVFLSMLTFLLWVILWTLQFFAKTRISLRNYLFNRAKVTMLIVTYLMFPEILRKCFSLMNCVEIDNFSMEQVLLLSPDMTCWKDTHMYYLLISSLPGLIVWGLFTPVFLMFLLYRFRGKIQENIRIYQKRFSIASRKSPIPSQKIIAAKSRKGEIPIDEKKVAKLKKRSIVVETFQKLEMEKSLKTGEKGEKSLFNFEKTEKDSSYGTVKKIDKIENEDHYFEKVQHFETSGKMEKSTKKSARGESSANMESSKKKSTRNKRLKNSEKIFESNSLASKSTLKPLKPDLSQTTKHEFGSNSNNTISDKGLNFEVATSGKNINGTRGLNFEVAPHGKNAIGTKRGAVEIRRMTSNLDKLQKMEGDLQKEFGYLLKFLYRGYRFEYYYWEIVLYTKKFLLIFIGSFSEFFPNTTKATILLIILTYYLFLQARQKPYETYFLNNIEYFSLIVTFLTANSGIMLFTPDLHKYSQIFLMMIIFINFSYIVLWCYYFYTYVIKISRLSPRIEKYLKCCFLLSRTLKGLVLSIVGVILNKKLALKIKNFCKRLFSWKIIVFKGILGDILGKKKSISKIALTKESSES